VQGQRREWSALVVSVAVAVGQPSWGDTVWANYLAAGLEEEEEEPWDLAARQSAVE
jgi:hypothetical protein